MDPNALAVQIQLRILDLSYNKITTLGPVLDELTGLTSLKLDNNKIQDLNNVTLDCQNLVELFVHDNLLESVPAFVKNCRQMKMLDLANNKIKALEDGTFSGMSSLYGLSLAGNQLANLTNQTFANISQSLNMLNLARNSIESIERAAFQDMKELRALRLDNNNLGDLNGLVSHLTSLNWLNVSSNNLEWFDYAFIPNSLVWLDVSYNKIGDLGNFYSLENFNLQTLEAGHNLIAKLDPASFLESLIHVRLDNNLVEEVSPNAFAQLDNLQMADLQSNQIRHLTIDSMVTSGKNLNGKIKVFKIIGGGGDIS
jgi:Leucine-rich repeat (LRR) protein